MDKERFCPMEKAVRVRIASQFPDVLKMGGLTVREHAGKQVYERLPLAVKTEMAKRGAERLKGFRKGS